LRGHAGCDESSTPHDGNQNQFKVCHIAKIKQMMLAFYFLEHPNTTFKTTEK
jgi:hypothetical protein